MRNGTFVVLAVVVWLVGLVLPVAAQSRGSQPANAHLATLDIAIWPEYDQPAVLVIYRGQIAAESPLPTNVFVSIPATVMGGQPHAVAVEDPAQGLLNLPYTVEQQGNWIQVSFTTAHPSFQLEFYDVLDLTQPERHYTLTWPGDMDIDSITLQVQEPFGATNFQVTPPVEQGQRRDDGLIYHPASLGSLQADQSVTIELAYRRTDSRTSAEALGLIAPTPPPQTLPASPSFTSALPTWMVAGIAIGVVLIIAGVAWHLYSRQEEEPEEYTPPAVWQDKQKRRSKRKHAVPRSQRKQRQAGPQKQPVAAAFCTQCGRALRAGDTFCPKCGTRRRS